MESVVTLLAEWFSLEEMIKLQEPSAIISDNFKEWQDKETLDLIGDQAWDDMTEKWTEFVWRKQQSCPTNMDVLDFS